MMDESTKEQAIWATTLIVLVLPIILFGGTCGMRGCETTRQQSGQSSALKMECLKNNRTPAECDALR